MRLSAGGTFFHLTYTHKIRGTHSRVINFGAQSNYNTGLSDNSAIYMYRAYVKFRIDYRRKGRSREKRSRLNLTKSCRAPNAWISLRLSHRAHTEMEQHLNMLYLFYRPISSRTYNALYAVFV